MAGIVPTVPTVIRDNPTDGGEGDERAADENLHNVAARSGSETAHVHASAGNEPYIPNSFRGGVK